MPFKIHIHCIEKLNESCKTQATQTAAGGMIIGGHTRKVMSWNQTQLNCWNFFYNRWSNYENHLAKAKCNAWTVRFFRTHIIEAWIASAIRMLKQSSSWKVSTGDDLWSTFRHASGEILSFWTELHSVLSRRYRTPWEMGISKLRTGLDDSRCFARLNFRSPEKDSVNGSDVLIKLSSSVIAFAGFGD